MSFGALGHASRLLGARRNRTTLCIVGALVAVASAAPVGPGAEAAPTRYSKTSRSLRPGLTMIKVADSLGPNRIRVLKIDPSTSLTLDVELANDRLPGRETTSSMANRRGAIAAVNGNFGTDWGRPLGLFAEDGELQSSPIASGGVFALSKDERTAYVGYPDLRMVAQNLSSGARWDVSDWNDQYPTRGAIAGYTSSGGDQVRPPQDACSVRLVPATRLAWDTGKLGVSRTYSIEKARCARRRLSPMSGVVLASAQGTAGARTLSAARAGQSVRLGWSLGWAGVVDAIGGSPVLMRDGAVMVSPCGGYVCQRHPRTGVGVTPTGEILLVTVDGRQSNSVGLDIVQFARLFKWLGAESAMNLDGGGSTTMVVRGRVVNSPSDGRERPVVSSLLVLPGPDTEEPRPQAP